MPPPAILMVGEPGRAEFRPAIETVYRYGRVSAARNLDEAELLLDQHQLAVDLVVLVQSFPGEISVQALDRLRRRVPLARIIGLLGSWCEGEMRSGDPWPAAIRVYWHQWPARCAAELNRMMHNQTAAWSLPATATEEERLLVESHDSMPTGTGLVAVWSRGYEIADWLCEACRQQGYSTVWLNQGRVPRFEGVLAALYDMADTSPNDFAELTAFAAQLRPAPVFALMHFPRIQDLRNAACYGAASVLSKPLVLHDLFRQLAGLRAGLSA